MNDTFEIFNPLLDSLRTVDVGYTIPTSFQDYLREHNFPKVNTAKYMSIDSLEVLHPSVKTNDTMILRLGLSEGTGMQFSLVKVKNRLNDFFLIDDEIFMEEGEMFTPEVDPIQFFSYGLLPNLTESSLVNLGFSSGLISYALELDEIKPIFPPATCKTVFTFDFKPHSLLDVVFTHNRGQVEIDSVFVERRNSKHTIFVVEAKNESVHRSLAKHKLLYPVLGIAPQVPKEMDIVPVYIKIYQSMHEIHFNVVECEVPDPRERIIAYDELRVKKVKHLILNKSILKSTITF